MVTDQQVRRLMKLTQSEATLTHAASKAGMDEKTARKYRRANQVPSQTRKPRQGRTRPDAFEAVPALLTRFGVANDPPQDCRVRNRQAPLTKNHDQIPATQFEAKVPAKAEENNVVFEPTSGESRIPFGHVMRHDPLSRFPVAVCTRTVSVGWCNKCLLHYRLFEPNHRPSSKHLGHLR